MTRTIYPRRVTPTLGWEPHLDERDREFPMEAFMEMGAVPLPTSVMYNTGPVLNQGPYPMCVGYSWRQWLTTDPVANTAPDPTGKAIYCAARTLDPWAGDCTTDLKQGTSVRAAAKFLQQRKLITTYVWAWSAETVRQWILKGLGPVVVGTRWYQSMYKPVGGRIIVNIKSALAGGHAYAITGYRDDTRMFRMTNSWGIGWGQSGHAWMRYTDLELLFSLQGECVTATERLANSVSAVVEETIPDILELWRIM